MNHTNPIVLLIEDDPVAACLVERAVINEIPNVRLLWARTVADATARAEGLAIDLFLVDIMLPDGSGLDFLWKMAGAHPSARAIVMTATPLPEYEVHSAALGVLHFLAKPLKIPSLLSQIREALGATSGDSEFSATLQNVTPADILQLKCLLGATTVIEFHSAGSSGRIHFENGEITDATTGSLRGVEAFYAIVAWKSGQVVELPGAGAGERTITGSWQSLLMEAAQQLDERHALAS